MHEVFGNSIYKLRTLDEKKLAIVLKYDELIILDCDHVTLCTTEEEVLEYIIISEKKTLSERIQENIFFYLQDLNCGNPKDPFMALEILGENWDKKLDNSC
ncbi:46233_t:CDS:2 [Gigaspora margarita]|uniref:46233_t:CDS:1 n=1 Tax=Gigaspora margarita TaxID=4874 RepID=A0ABN7VJ63_GIGMA|nr:46233_t:CDS:2 [Gigaspora margarita]